MEEITTDNVVDVSQPTVQDTGYTEEQIDNEYPDSFSMFNTGIDKSFEGIPDGINIPQEEEEITENPDESENPDETVEEKFIQDGIDLSFVPEELRKETAAETLLAFNDDAKAKSSELEKNKVDLENYKNLLKKEGFTNEFEAFYQTQERNIEQLANQELNRAFTDLDTLVKEGKMSVHEANVKYGEVKANLETVKTEEKEKAYAQTNLAVVERLIGEHEEVLNNPVIAQATEVFLKDIVQDKRLVSFERSSEYLKIAKGIYDEAFKAGLAAYKQAEAKQNLEQTKNKVRKPQVVGGNTNLPPQQQFPYKSWKEVPDDVWMNDDKVRRHFLSQELANGAF